MGKDVSFGSAIADARKALDMSQKELAAAVKKEDGDSITPQYLNDIEHDRRSPSSDLLVEQFARLLKIEKDYLYFLSGRLPSDVRAKALTPSQVTEVMTAFRKRK